MGKVTLVGLGPGGREYMTEQAISAIEQADTVCGYTVYTELVKKIFPKKETYSTPMQTEIARCEWAVNQAENGRNIALVCSGDSGVYGMASPLLRIALERGVSCEIVPGVMAAVSGAAVLGAPINHDFCTISLSDRLTSWEVIVSRLEHAAQGDFCICLYNPMSHHRPHTLRDACDILLKFKDEKTACGWVRNIGRDGEEHGLLSLGELRDFKCDMFTTVFVGNSETEIIGGRMVTPRGYR